MTGTPPAADVAADVPEVSVIAPHLNQPDHLADFLASLFAQDFDMARAEVIIVDNGSRPLPESVVARFPGVRLVEESEPGPGPARNRGAALARAEILAFADSDCRVAKDWLPAILARFAADPDLAALGGDIRVYPAVEGDPTPAEAYEAVYAFRQQLYIERQGYSVTANMAVRRKVFEAVGGFGGIAIAEDNDWGRRAREMGFATVWAPEVRVRHPARASLAEIEAKWARLISHHHAAEARGLAGRARWTLKALALVASPLAEIPRLVRSDRLASPRERRLAFQALAAVRLWRARQMLAVMLRPAARPGTAGWNRR
jgi:GT2 family glycosyltransferase